MNRKTHTLIHQKQNSYKKDVNPGLKPSKSHQKCNPQTLTNLIKKPKSQTLTNRTKQIINKQKVKQNLLIFLHLDNLRRAGGLLPVGRV